MAHGNGKKTITTINKNKTLTTKPIKLNKHNPNKKKITNKNPFQR